MRTELSVRTRGLDGLARRIAARHFPDAEAAAATMRRSSAASSSASSVRFTVCT